MILKLKRIIKTDSNTIGLLFIDGVFECFTLEDLPHEPKIYGKTRIPSGSYQIKFRKEGTLHEKYSKKFPETHRGMLHLQNVTGFQYIYIHIGNKDEDTLGCILVGSYPSTDFKTLISSTTAYTRLYNKLRLENDIKIVIEDEN